MRKQENLNHTILALNIYLNVQFRATYRHVESQVLLSQDLFRKIALIKAYLRIEKDTKSL